MSGPEKDRGEPSFELEFDSLQLLREAARRCRSEGVARVPGVSLAIGSRCQLVFCHRGRPVVSLLGTVTASSDQPASIELDVDRARGARVGADPLAALRNLSAAQVAKLARTARQRERVGLERMYGGAVWEALLANPRITHPEVARIARKRSLPNPLVAIIVENSGWLASSAVRRALLSNPRLSSPLALRVLKRTPKPELKLVPKQTAYPALIRELANNLLKS